MIRWMKNLSDLQQWLEVNTKVFSSRVEEHWNDV